MTANSKVPAALARATIAFQTPAFRWLWIAAVFGAMAFGANSLAMGWLVLETTDSAFWVGAVGAASGVGQVGFGVFAGVLLDRFDKRRVLLFSQLSNALLPFIVGLLVYSEQIALWHLFIASFTTGILSSIRSPAFNTMTFQLVGAKGILNASAAMNMSFNLAGILSPLATGFLIDRQGEASGFFLATLFGLVGVTCISRITGTFLSDSVKEPVLQAAVAGLRYVWTNLQLRNLLSLSLIGETFGFSFHVMMPVVAKNVLGLDATGLGTLSAARGIGAALGTLLVASLGDYQHKGWLLVRSVTGAGVFMILFGLSPWYSVSLGLVAVLGAMLTTYDITMKSLILMLAGDKWRGRVQSIYTLTYGFVSLGGLLAGSVASLIGVSYALAINGGVLVTFINTFSRSFMRMSDQEIE
ncbi:MAG: MFS transporter [Candidatus Promineifilaceae bacterium]